MHNISQRANAVFALFVSVCFSMLAVIAVTNPILLLSSKPSVAVKSTDVVVKMGVMRRYTYEQPIRAELGKVRFDLEADLTSLFNWNTKLLFLYLVAEYQTPDHKFNQVVIWDHIVKGKEEADLNIVGQGSKYLVYDMSNKLAGKKANLTLHWNLVPHVGLFLNNQQGHGSITFPAASQ